MESNQTCDTWTAEVRRAAFVAVELAATRLEASERTLAYFLRAAVGHGLTVEDCCRAGNLERDEVMRLIDPAVA